MFRALKVHAESALVTPRQTVDPCFIHCIMTALVGMQRSKVSLCTPGAGESIECRDADGEDGAARIHSGCRRIPHASHPQAHLP